MPKLLCQARRGMVSHWEIRMETILPGFFKIKYRGIGIRVVYTLVLDERIMNIIVISVRDDNFCYEFAKKLYKKYGDSVFKDIFDTL